MDIFPTQYSTLSAKALKDYLGKIYGLALLSCRLLIRNVSDVYVLEDRHAKYIFKIYRDTHRKLDEIRGEVELLALLREKGIPVSYTIMDQSGQAIQRFQAAEGIRHGVLFSFAKGRVVSNPNEKQLRIIGREVGLMHNITATCALQYPRIVYDEQTTLERPLKIMQERFANMPDEYAFLQKTADRVIEKMKQFDKSAFSFGYCHYDLIPKNFHFDEADRITFFDFDWAGKGYLANDLMTFLVQLFFIAHYKTISREAADEHFGIVVDAYREVRAFSEQELDAIPWLGLMFWIYAFGFYEDNYDDFANTFLTPKFIKERIALIGKWIDWYCG